MENLDGSPESIILESLLVGMAEYYSQNLAREVRKGMKETALPCKHNGGIPPLGYDVAEDKTYIINEIEAAAIRLIFKLYSIGYGYKQIVSKLKDRGYKTKSGNDFTQSSLHNILNNEKYMVLIYSIDQPQKLMVKGTTTHLKATTRLLRYQAVCQQLLMKSYS